MLRSRQRASVVVTLSMVILSVPGTSAYATAPATAMTWWTSQSVLGGSDTLLDVACPTITSCTAVGSKDTTKASGQAGLILSWGPRGWKTDVAPPGQPTLLDSVSCATAASCVVVGTAGKSLYSAVSHHGLWTAVPIGSTGIGSEAPVISSVSCESPTSCMAVGVQLPSERPLAFYFNGAKWAERRLPVKLAYAVLKTVSCDGGTELDCTAVGAVVARSSAFSTNQGALPGIVRFQGRSSTAVNLPLANAGLNAIVCTQGVTTTGPGSMPGDDCIAGGAIGTRAETPLVLDESDRHWRQTNAPSSRDASSVIRLSCPLTTARCAAIVLGPLGAREVIETLWRGHWTVQPVSFPRGNYTLSGISCVAATTGPAECTGVGSESAPAGAEHSFVIRGLLSTDQP